VPFAFCYITSLKRGISPHLTLLLKVGFLPRGIEKQEFF